MRAGSMSVLLTGIFPVSVLMGWHQIGLNKNR